MAKAELIKNMEVVLANSYVLYLKTQNYHWNVSGTNFFSLHQLFEEQYQDLAEAVDSLAERIRTLGAKVKGTFPDFEAISTIEHARDGIDAKDMLQQLAEDQQKLVKLIKDALDIAEKVGDGVTVEMLTERMAVHEKNAWMLRSSV